MYIVLFPDVHSSQIFQKIFRAEAHISRTTTHNRIVTSREGFIWVMTFRQTGHMPHDIKVYHMSNFTDFLKRGIIITIKDHKKVLNNSYHKEKSWQIVHFLQTSLLTARNSHSGVIRHRSIIFITKSHQLTPPRPIRLVIAA